ERTKDFPKIVRELEALPDGDFILDGEVVTFDPKGVSRFQIFDREKAVLVLFDCLERDGRSIRNRSLAERRRALEELAARESAHLKLARRLPKGLAAYRQAKKAGWEASARPPWIVSVFPV